MDARTEYLATRAHGHGKRVVVQPQMAENQVSLPALCYTIRDIIHPTVLFEQVPELLDLLAQVELVRRKMHTLADSALQFQEHFRLQGASDIIFLAREEMKTLEKITSKDIGSRDIFFQAMKVLVSLDITQLWISSEDSHLLPLHFRTFFPRLSLGQLKTRWLFHATLSTQERDELELDTGLACQKFLRDAYLWEEKRIQEEEGQPNNGGFYEHTTFRALSTELLGSLGVKDVVHAIDRYLTVVETMSDQLTKIFAASEV
ncbi:hypothetical protein BV25DRAFT_139314 [Artomyces pyxidatus]|uniref:Uncharacterized protein n=1 Tax=Artomyces pyxidatus TaxID=48021 RepID=A0ACB8TA04_9AGAM|nr:hypothetical protein BV25DRAFT_139314 [Artomyces pyxidatus]